MLISIDHRKGKKLTKPSKGLEKEVKELLANQIFYYSL